MQLFIVLTVLLVLVAPQGYDTTSTYTCLQENSAGRCIQWQQVMYTEPSTKCFPASAKVMTKQGLKTMNQIEKGQQVLGLKDGKQVFSEITSWFHYQPEKVVEYLKVNVEGGHFEVSAKHNVAVQKSKNLGIHGLEYKFGQELSGELLFQLGKVDSVEKVQSKGVFAPKTATNNYFIYLEGNINRQQRILAHSFAHIRNPELYESTFEIMESTWNLFYPPPADEKVNPCYKWMEETFTYWQE